MEMFASGKSNDNTKKESLVDTCIVAVLSGFSIGMLYPPYMPIALVLKYTGVLGLGYYAMRWSRFDKLFKNLGLGVGSAYPLFKNKTSTEYSDVHKFTLPCGLCLKDFEDKKDEIEQYLGKDIDIKYTHKEIYIEVYKDKMKTLYDYIPTDIKGDIPILIGYDRHGNFVSCDLANGEPHMIIAGETGSGKSTVLRSIICNLILKSDVKLHLIDLKMGAEFNVFSKSSKVVSFGRTIKEASEILNDISIEVDRRYDICFKHDVKDTIDYNKKFPKKKFDKQILIIDEFADLQYEKETTKMLEQICRKARACSIHVILSTQRPDCKVLTGGIKINVGTVLGLKTLNGTNSNIIIDCLGLEKLRGKGHGLFKRGNITEIQAPFISTEDVKKLIKHTYIDKQVVKKEVDNGNIIDFDFMEGLDDNNKRSKNN